MSRIFMYNGMQLEDPDPAVSPEEVKNIYSGVYSELVQAKIEGPLEKDGNVVFTFRRVVGTKGEIEAETAGEELQAIDIATELCYSLMLANTDEIPPSEVLGII